MNRTLQGLLLWLIFLLSPVVSAQDKKVIAGEKNITYSPQDSMSLYMTKGDSLLLTKDYKKAAFYYSKIFETKIIHNDSLWLEAGNKLANQLFRLQKFPESKKINAEIRKFCMKKNKIPCIIETYGRSSAIEKNTGNPHEALLDLNKAVELCESDAPDMASKVYHTRGFLLNSMNQGKAARNDYRKALSYLNKAKDSFQVAALISSISATFSEKELDSVLYYNQLAVNYCKGRDLDGLCMTVYNNLASTLLTMNKPEKAKKIINENIDQNNLDNITSKDNVRYRAFMHTLGEMYLKLEEYGPAINKLEVAKNASIKHNDLRALLKVLNDLAKAYELSGDPQAALENIRLIQPIQDSLNVQKVQQEVAKLESERKLKEKEKEVLALQEEKEIITLRMSKVQLISYILGIILLAGALFFVYKNVINKARLYKLQEKMNYNRLLSLQSAMNPHFLFNSFGTLQHHILKKDVPKAMEYMTTLSNLIRDVFSNSKSIYIHFNEEVQILQSYIDLEADRFEGTLNTHMEIDPKLTERNPLIPSMIIQPYIENAIVHGFARLPGCKQLTITFAQKDINTVQCTVTDNGVGRETAAKIQTTTKTKEHLSVATKNTVERLKIIAKEHGQEGSITIQDLYDDTGASSGTQVLMSLPIITSTNPIYTL